MTLFLPNKCYFIGSNALQLQGTNIVSIFMHEKFSLISINCLYSLWHLLMFFFTLFVFLATLCSLMNYFASALCCIFPFICSSLARCSHQFVVMLGYVDIFKCAPLWGFYVHSQRHRTLVLLEMCSTYAYFSISFDRLWKIILLVWQN